MIIELIENTNEEKTKLNSVKVLLDNELMGDIVFNHESEEMELNINNELTEKQLNIMLSNVDRGINNIQTMRNEAVDLLLNRLKERDPREYDKMIKQITNIK